MLSNASLHTLNKTSLNVTLNLRLSQLISEEDSVILIEDGVYQCLQLFSAQDSAEIRPWPHSAKNIYAIKEDALARGITLASKNIEFISYNDFVSLSLSHKKVISWY